MKPTQIPEGPVERSGCSPAVQKLKSPITDTARAYDRAIPAPAKSGALGPIRFGRALAAERIDVALLLPNSWSSAVEAFVARIPRRIGYAKDGRGVLLTERLKPIKVGRLRPVP